MTRKGIARMSNLINVYPQRPAAAHAESPLFHAGLEQLAGKGSASAGVTVREKKLLGHLTLGGDGKDPAFAGGVHKALGLELPVALTLVAAGDTSLQWLAPDEWLLILPSGSEFAVEQKVREVLMKSTSYDVHPSNFPVGKAVGTHFAKSQLVIRHTGEDTWELLIRRSFSDYFWLWLQDASAEYGLAIKA